MTDVVTVRGFVATSPTQTKLSSGASVTNFRLASTPRWYDSQQQCWREGSTNWLTINAFRGLAQNTSRSVFVGQPLIVAGRLNIKTWERPDGTKGTSAEIDAQSIGHDLTFGTASFTRTIQGNDTAPSQPQNTNQENTYRDTRETIKQHSVEQEQTQENHQTAHTSPHSFPSPHTDSALVSNTANRQHIAAMTS